MVILAVIVGGVGVFTTGHLLENDANRMINLIANVQEEELNILLKGVEQSVQIMETQALSNLESVDRLVNDEEYRQEYSEHLCGLFKNVSKHINGAIAFYLRYNPYLITEDKGFLWNRPDVGSKFSAIEPTNILDYDSRDKENVGWYHIPVEKGEASWIMPHQNKGHGGYMISYVIPMYAEGQLIGVVGMGLDFDIFMKELEYVSIYKTDHIYLLNENGTVAYHKSIPSGSPRPEAQEGQLISETTLENGMVLVVNVDKAEIYYDRDMRATAILAICIVIVIVFIGITVFLTRRLIKPLKELTEATKKMQEGEYRFSFSMHTNDEIGVLSDSFKAAAEHLNQYMVRIRELAYIDSSTGVKNTTAYNEEVQSIEIAMETENEEFGLIVFDVNNLKKINDSLGHKAGDMLLKSDCHLICRTFKRSPVYCIGGDEFVVILRGDDYDEREALIHRFYTDMRHTTFDYEGAVWHVSVAHGLAVYEKNDTSFVKIFSRADSELYKNKAEMKRVSNLTSE